MYRRGGNDWSTSDQLARSVRTNPVVIRRLLGELRRAGLVESRRGANAGWRLLKASVEITLCDINSAVGAKSAFALHRNEPSDRCPVARGIRPVLLPIYARVDEVVRAQLARTTLDDILRAIEENDTGSE